MGQRNEWGQERMGSDTIFDPRQMGHFNYSYKRSGILWEGRYRATVVDSERYLLTLMRAAGG